MKQIVYKWLNNKYLKLVKNRSTSAPPPKSINNEYMQSIRDLINPIILTSDALKLNKFSIKYKSYTNVLCNDKPSE